MTATALRLVGAPRPIDVGVWLAVALLFGGSAAFARISQPERRTIQGLDGAVQLTLPAGYGVQNEADELVVQRPALGSIAPRLSVRRVVRPTTVDPALFRDLELTRIEQERAHSGLGYRTLDAGDEPSFGAEHSSFSRYAVVQDPPLARAGDAVMPRVVTGLDALVVNGEDAYHVSTSVDASDSEGAAELDAILATLRVGS